MTHPTKIYWLDATTTTAKLLIFIQTQDFVLDAWDTFAVNTVALINKQYAYSATSQFCPNCTKAALNAVFVEKDIDERCYIFLESISKWVRVLEENSQANSSNLKALETSIERNNLNINSCLSSFKNLKERVDFLEKTNTKQVPSTINPSNIVLTNSPTLITN